MLMSKGNRKRPRTRQKSKRLGSLDGHQVDGESVFFTSVWSDVETLTIVDDQDLSSI